MTSHNKTKYHDLYLALQSADDYFPKEDRKELLELIATLYEQNIALQKQIDSMGRYGIRYKTIEDDSSYSETHEQFFQTVAKRDSVLR